MKVKQNHLASCLQFSGPEISPAPCQSNLAPQGIQGFDKGDGAAWQKQGLVAWLVSSN